MPRQFPELFVILRDGFRNPCLQLLRSFERQRRGPYEIANVANVDDYDGRLVQVPYPFSNYHEIHTLHYINTDTGEESQVYYWFTPYVLEYSDRQLIPLLEFQYRSWIPTGYTPMPIRVNLNELYDALSQIQEEKLREIRRREDDESMREYRSSRYHSSYRPLHTQQDIRVPSWMRNWDNEHPRLRTPSPPPPRIIESVRLVEVPVERIVTQVKALPIPKAVGDLLLSNARKGADSCPIAATPFAECEKLCVSSCFHIFDSSSLTRWQESHTTCPVCRCKIENVVIEERPNALPTM